MKRKALVCAVILALAIPGVVGCTRAKPEAVTPTVPAAATTPVPTVPVATQTHLITVQPPPTSVTAAAGPTTVSVAEVTPGLVQGATPIVVSPTSVVVGAATPVAGSGTFDYTVQWGDTLFSLAQRYNTTVNALVALNGLQNASSIRAGQVLRISGAAVEVSGTSEYTVQQGDTLYSIARRYGTTVDAIRYANGIVSDWYIRVGQTLHIPAGGGDAVSTGSSSYVVQAGDTLYGIAARFGKSAWDLIVANNLSDPYWLWVGQVLVIPS
jgi:LysM repeat protein